MAEQPKKYPVKGYAQLKGLKGISDELLAVHFKLYEGYVNRCNALTEKLYSLDKESRAKGTDATYAELTRRLGYEYNGMRLHELYFENMMPGAQPAPTGMLKDALGKSFGTYDLWLADFKAIATMPGVGWAITYQNPTNGWLSNHWISMHQEGHPAGFRPILVMDAWEHAFMPDYKATERAKYVDAFFQNLDWSAVESRLMK